MSMTNWLVRFDLICQDTSLYVSMNSSDSDAMKLMKPIATTARSHGCMFAGSGKDLDSGSSGGIAGMAKFNWRAHRCYSASQRYHVGLSRSSKDCCRKVMKAVLEI
jgi:hypothetical protein